MTVLERGFLLGEDQALKAKLSGIFLSDGKGGKTLRVRTFYQLPDDTKMRQYPCITISLIDVEFASDRNHSSEVVDYDYWPSEYADFAAGAAAHGLSYDPATQRPQAARWQPYDLTYQVSTLCRNTKHDRELSALLYSTAYLPRTGWGYLQVPQDGSERWLDVDGWVQSDYLEGSAQTNNRVFRKVYNVRVSAHLPPEDPIMFSNVVKVAGSFTAAGSNVVLDTWST